MTWDERQSSAVYATKIHPLCLCRWIHDHQPLDPTTIFRLERRDPKCVIHGRKGHV